LRALIFIELEVKLQAIRHVKTPLIQTGLQPGHAGRKDEGNRFNGFLFGQTQEILGESKSCLCDRSFKEGDYQLANHIETVETVPYDVGARSPG
jgi:hypothetical protein